MKKLVPLSVGQQGLWYLARTSDDACASYNVVLAFDASGPLSPEEVFRAFDIVVEQHPVLGGRILVQDHVPWLECNQHRRSPVGTRKGCLRDGALAEAGTPIDLETGPLYRVAIVESDLGTVGLLITVHHIVFDGLSAEVLLDALEAAFEQNVRIGSEIRLNLPDRLYAERESAFLASDRGRALIDGKASFLKDLGFPTTLPIAAARSGAVGPAGRVSIDIAAELFDPVRVLANELATTPAAVYLSAFFMLIWQYTQQRDLAVVMPVDARELEDRSSIGYMVNMAILGATLSPADSLAEVIDKVTDQQFDALAARSLPFPALVRATRRLGGDAGEAWLNIMFGYASEAQRKRTLGNVELTAKETPPRFAKSLVKLDVFDLGSEARALLDYDASAIESLAAERMLGHYRFILERILENPSRSLQSLPLLSPSERRQILVEWNDTSVDCGQGKGVHRLFEEQVERTPMAVAVAFQGQQLTYAELDAKATQLARRLGGLGVKPGSIVAICMERGLQMVVGLLGILKAGGAYLPLDPGFPADRLIFMVQDSGTTVVLSADGAAERIALPSSVQVLDLTTWTSASNADLPSVSLSDPAYVIYTSGSTGKPKGVVVPHAALVNFLYSMRRKPGLAQSDVLAAITTISFDIAGLELFLPLIVGARVELVPREIAGDGAALMERLKFSRTTVLQATPATWRLLLDAGWVGGPGFRALCGGEGMSRELADALLERTGEVWNLYGPTETTVWSTVERVTRGSGSVSIGRPIDNTQVYVLNEAGDPLPAGVAGELWIGGLGVASGYLGRPQLTSERFVPDRFARRPGARLYRTGDVARWTQQGRLEHLGRIDQQIKIRGFRIELGEIEAALRSCKGVREAIVLSREDEPGDKRLIAYVVSAICERVAGCDLREQLSRTLPDYMIPAAWVLLNDFPMTPNGKIDRLALSSLEIDQSNRRESMQLPVTETEQWVAEVWRQVLNVTVVGRQDNFFALGGHSLLATQIVARVSRTLARAVPLRMLLDSPTLSDFAARLDRLPAPADGARTIPALTRRPRSVPEM